VTVVRANVLGFCMGVRRAVDLAEAEARRGFPVYTLGPLIHNPKVLSDLKTLGVQETDELPQFAQGSGGVSVIIRAHGIEPDIEAELRGRGFHIADATCPNVKASQLKAEELTRKGYCIFLAGEANHAEIKGIMGYAKDTVFCEVAGNAAEAGKIAKKLYAANSNAKTAILGQTTISEKEYREISEAVKLFFPNLEVVQTICAATKERQQAMCDLLDQVDAVIVAGGKDSANTRRLLAIAQESGKPCALAEEPSEIPAEFFNYEKVGLCAGASTPDSIINDIEQKLILN